MDSLTSKTILFLRFPLCIAVVLLHTHFINADGIDNMYNASYPFYSNITYFIGCSVSRSLFKDDLTI